MALIRGKSYKVDKRIKSLGCYKYANNCITGKQIASMYLIQAAERFMSDLSRKDLIFSVEEAQKITTFSEKVIYVPELKAPAQMPLPHAFWKQQLYGWQIKKTGLRRFTEVYLQVARKNRKTYEAAVITLYEALLGADTSGEIMHGANSREQALYCTNMTGKIIRASPELNELVKSGHISLYTYKEKYTRIVFNLEESFCEVEAMPKDPGDGGNPSALIVDELQEAKSLTLLETGESGQGARLQPLTVIITSPGHNKGGPCYSVLRNKSLKVLSGAIKDDSFLPIVFELDNEKEWDKIKLLEKSNPMIPYSPTLKPNLKKRIKKAHDNGGEIMVSVKIKNSGIWVDAPYIWIPTETIKKNNRGITLKEILDLPSFAGLDLSAGMDLNAFINFVPNVRTETRKIKRDGKFIEKEFPIHAVYSQFWIPQHKIDNQKNDVVDYRRWVDEGWINVFEGNTVEYDVIAQDMIELMNKLDVRVLGADPKYLTTGPAGYLNNAGYLEPNGNFVGLIPVAQAFNLTAAVSEIEIWANNNQLDFMNNPVMEWCFSNTTLHVKDMQNEEGGLSGHRYPSKGRSTGRIDGVTAFCTSVHEYLRLDLEPEPVSASFQVWN